MNIDLKNVTLCEKLNLIDIQFPEWPNDFFRENSDLIKDGLKYHHVIILRRSILRNLSLRKKNIFRELIEIMLDQNTLPIWEYLVFAFLEPEVYKSPEYERWQICTKLIRSSALTMPQLYAAAIELSSQKMFSASLYCFKRIIEETEATYIERQKVLTSIIENINFTDKYNILRNNPKKNKELTYLIRLNQKLIQILLNTSKSPENFKKELNELIIFVDQNAKGAHGHYDFLKICNDKLKTIANDNSVNKFALVEVGCSREIIEGQNSTHQLINLANDLSLKFIGIDIDQDIINSLKRDYLSPNVKYIRGRGEDVLKKLDKNIAAIYFDGYDFFHNEHSNYRQKIYIEEYGESINDEKCYEVHLECVKSVSDKIIKGGIIGFDDTWRKNEEWEGKGKKAVPWLISNGWEMIYSKNKSCIFTS